MYNRHDFHDPEIIERRAAFLANHEVMLDDAVRLRVDYDTDDFCRYIEVGKADKGAGMRDDKAPPSDALITTTPGVALFLPLADCIGALIYDHTQHVLALAHLGRHSLEQQGGTKIIQHLVDHYGCSVENLEVFLTPAAGKDNYKIWALDNKGMKEAAHEQLAAASLISAQIHDNDADTTTSDLYYSYSEYLKGNRQEDGDHAIFGVMR